MNLKEKLARSARRMGFFRRVKRVAARRKAGLREKLRDVTRDIATHDRWLAENRGASRTQTEWHQGRLRELHEKRQRVHEKLLFWRKRWVWARNRDEFWTELHAAQKRKQGARKIDASDFKNEMTGSHEYWTLTPAAKAAVAIGILHFGLWVSSTYRSETPGSHHAEDPTRGADLAGEWDNMIRFQRWLYENHLSALLELYGPNNALCADNGAPAPQAEGTFNEDLHDSHDHVFIADADYALAFPA